MAVEIFILSGARQGERLVLSATEFRAGAEPDCAVCFDPRADAGAANRWVCFRLLDDGWYVTETAGAVLINHQVVAGRTRIRSGDIVRMSQGGPDFSFSIAARAAAPVKSPGRTPAEPQSAPGAASPLPAASPVAAALPPAPASVPTDASPLAAAPLPTSGPADRVFARTAPPGSGAVRGPQSPGVAAASTPAPLLPTAAVPIATSPGPTVKAQAKVYWLLALGGGLAVFVVLAMMLVLLMRGPTVVVLPPTELGARSPVPPAGPAEGQTKTAPADSSVAPPVSASAAAQAQPPVAVSKEEQLAAQLRDAVYLVLMEKADRFWPFASCCAIGENTLLTSAQEAWQLAQWRKDPQMDCKVWVINPASGVKMAVQEIRTHAAFMALGDKPNDWIYFDLALLTVAEKLPKVAPLASAEELDRVREGLAVYSVGFSHEGEKGAQIADFDSFRSQATRGKIFIITASPSLPSQPRLLQMKGKFPQNISGSPIVDEQGRVIAVYGTAAKPPERNGGDSAGPLGLELHFAPVLNWHVMDLALHEHDTKLWISPDTAKSNSPSQDQR